jgi:hypothetical protein
MKHVNPSNKLLLPKGLLQQVDRGTLELSMHLITLSLSLVRILLIFVSSFHHLRNKLLETSCRVYGSCKKQAIKPINILFGYIQTIKKWSQIFHDSFQADNQHLNMVVLISDYS